MKKFNKIISMLLVTVMIITGTGVQSASSSVYEKEEAIRAKISPELAEVMEKADKNELIPIVIFRNTIPKKTITELVLKETGKNLENYYDSILYEKNVKAVIEKAVEEKYGKENAHIVDKETGMSPVRTALHKDATELLKVKRAITKQEYEKSNNEFISKHINKEREITYNGMYTSTIIVEATINEINKYASLNDVGEIMFYEPLVAEPAMQHVMGQIGAEIAKNGAGYNGGAGYKGRGSVIGVVEVNSTIDLNNPHFVNNYNVLFVPSSAMPHSNTKSDHATLVTALINGKAVTRSSQKFEGVAPEAFVCQTSVRDKADDYEVLDAINNLIDNYGVNIINLSLGSSNPNSYTWYDRDVDNIIYTTGVTIVVAAGNLGINTPYSAHVTSPGKALNAITVGNAQTKTSSTAVTNATAFPINAGTPLVLDTSCHISPSFLPNKPDITAPGTYITMAKGSTTYTDTGTSFAAPIVAGLAAHAIERDYSLMFNPASIKAWLILNADLAKMSSVNTNDFVANTSSQLRVKSGAGLVNATKIDLGYNYMYGSVYQGDTVSTQWAQQWTSGRNVRAVLVFDKSHTDIITSAAGLEDVKLVARNKSTHAIIASTIDNTVQNVKILQFTAPTAGYYFDVVGIKQYDIYTPIEYSLFWRGT